MGVFQTICKDVGLTVSPDLAERSVLELLPCVKLTRTDAIRRPSFVAKEITRYLDDVAREP